MNDIDCLSRRQFLNRVSVLSALAALHTSGLLAASRTTDDELPAWAVQEPWLTLRAVQNQLLPATPDGPGADDIHAIVYLRNMLEQPGADRSSRDYIVGRVAKLDFEARLRHGSPFVDLPAAARKALFHDLVRDSAWRRWFSRHLTYLLEALLADPVYGGNFNRAGWRWLEHQPGFPGPHDGVLWFQLGSEVYFQQKAV